MSDTRLWHLAERRDGADQYQRYVENVRVGICLHEGGHAVIGRVLGIPCGEAYVDLEQNPIGFANLGSCEETWSEWQRQGRRRIPRHMFIGMAMAGMAGADAERVIIGCYRGGDTNDRECIAVLLKDSPQGVEARLRSFTKTLIRRHKDSIIAVARRLLGDVTLSDADIRSIIRLSRWRFSDERARTAPV
jgi:hypothetical protein